MSNILNNVCLVGYGGHSLLICELFLNIYSNIAYCDIEERKYNPFNLKYLGKETEMSDEFMLKYNYFVSIGDNKKRKTIFEYLSLKQVGFINAIHPSSSLSSFIKVGLCTFIAPKVIVNPYVSIGNGVICNSSSVLEHGVTINDFVHIGPGAIICGEVSIGEGTFIGAGSVIKEGISIGNNVVIGAGAVVINDIPDNVTVVGVPGRILY